MGREGHGLGWGGKGAVGRQAILHTRETGRTDSRGFLRKVDPGPRRQANLSLEMRKTIFSDKAKKEVWLWQPANP